MPLVPCNTFPLAPFVQREPFEYMSPKRMQTQGCTCRAAEYLNAGARLVGAMHMPLNIDVPGANSSTSTLISAILRDQCICRARTGTPSGVANVAPCADNPGMILAIYIPLIEPSPTSGCHPINYIVVTPPPPMHRPRRQPSGGSAQYGGGDWANLRGGTRRHLRQVGWGCKIRSHRAQGRLPSDICAWNWVNIPISAVYAAAPMPQ
ncbi:hypothetical protein B0H19DRAFT_1270237 [Mycena capillaripes]|nr:hypothetical protein B0H19DRAFT_1270237 [Mycena capillaripes]